MKKPYQPAFSLVELLVVVALVSLLAVAISSMVLTTIIQINRVRNQIRVRQSGDYALGQIQTFIRNSRKVIACDSSGDTITIINPDGVTTEFSLESLGTGTAIASNSGVYLTASDVTATSFDIECLPNDSDPRLIKVNFGLKRTQDSGRANENPTLNYETSIELRNI